MTSRYAPGPVLRCSALNVNAQWALSVVVIDVVLNTADTEKLQHFVVVPYLQLQLLSTYPETCPTPNILRRFDVS